MVRLTKEDKLYMEVSALDIVRIISILFLYMAVTLGAITLIMRYMLDVSVLMSMTAIVVAVSIILTFAMRAALKWSWGHIRVNETRYTFKGPWFGMFSQTFSIMFLVFAGIGISLKTIAVLLGASYMWWYPATGVLCVVMIAVAAYGMTRHMRAWVYESVEPQA